MSLLLRCTAALVASAVILTGCGSDPGFDERTAFVTTEGAAQFANLVPDSPEISIRHGLDQTTLPYGTTSALETRFVDKYNWDLSYINSSRDRVTFFEQENQQITEDFISVFLIMGTMGQINVQIVDLPIVAVADRPADQTEIWFASNSSNYSVVDIYVTDADATLADSSPVASVTSGSFTSLLSIPADTNSRLRITNGATETVLFDSGAFDLIPQSRVLFGVVDDFGPDGSNHVDVLLSPSDVGGLINDVSQTAAVRMTNMSSQAAVDVNLGSLSATGLSKPQFTSYSNITGGNYTLNVTDGVDSLESRELSVTSGFFQTVMSLDNPDANAAEPVVSLLTIDRYRTMVGRVLFRVINGSNQIVDVWALREGQDRGDVPPLLNDIGFNSTDPTEVILGRIRFQITTPDGAELLASTQETLTTGHTYTLIFDSEGELRIITD